MQKNALQYMIEPYKKYVTFSGRARRMEYWMFVLFCIFIGFSIGLIEATFITVFAIFNFLPSLAVSVRRLHDQNMNGWWVIASFIPIINILFLIFMCFRGTQGENNYGADPISAQEIQGA